MTASVASTNEVSTAATLAFDSAAPYELSEQVSLRDEPFGALAYHHGTRRLVFLKSRELVELVRRLGEFESARDAVAAQITTGEIERYLGALASLNQSGLLRGR